MQEEEEKYRYEKDLKKLMRRVDKLNQSMLIKEKIVLEKARINYKISKEEWERIKKEEDQRAA